MKSLFRKILDTVTGRAKSGDYTHPYVRSSRQDKEKITPSGAPSPAPQEQRHRGGQPSRGRSMRSHPHPRRGGQRGRGGRAAQPSGPPNNWRLPAGRQGQVRPTTGGQARPRPDGHQPRRTPDRQPARRSLGAVGPAPRPSRGPAPQAAGQAVRQAAPPPPAGAQPGAGPEQKAGADKPVQHPAPQHPAETRQGHGKGGRPHHRKAIPPLPHLIPVPPAEGKTRFTDLDIANEVLCGIQDLQFEYCTPIQQLCLPHLLAGKDVTGKAQTGTGKTAAFLASALTHILRRPAAARTPGSCRTLVLAPTRELAIQIYKDAEAISKYCGLNHLVLFGGMGYREQRDALERPIDILVGTPGRIIDYSRSGHLNLSKAEILVIDEADRMLDMGFIPDVRRIVSKLPPAGKRQTMFFSATLTPNIVRLVDRWLVDPVTVESEPEQLVTGLIDQRFYSVAADEKFALLCWIIDHDDASRIMVFCNRRDGCLRVVRRLTHYGIHCGLLTGDVPQEKRLRILDRFRSGATPVLVATDVAARGIHVESISHVINYDLPQDPEDYVHRIGRTGRAGEKGKSAAFVDEYGAFVIPALEKLLGSKIVCTAVTEDMVRLPAAPAPSPDNRRPSAGGDGQAHRRRRRGRRSHRPARGHASADAQPQNQPVEQSEGASNSPGPEGEMTGETTL